MKLFVKYGIFLFASVIALNSYNIKADENVTTSTDTNVSDTKEPATHEIIIGNNANSLSSLKQDEKNGSTEPTITNVEISGGVDPSVTGTDFFKDVEINLEGNNLTDDNFLTEEGLHWSDKTYTEIIQGKENGIINDPERFGASNTPSTPVIAYSTNVGDSGRINYIGKTLSGIELDLLWTVLESDKDEWASNSGYNDNRPKGLGFAGEQSILGATGNSIVILYNNASNLALHYQIVKHGTKIEQPVVVSFISTDIDAAQGVQTNLANLVEIIPTESNLVKKDGIIYDATPGVVGLNGSKDLPKGGYLGAGFISNFDYTFYSPAPERVNDSYSYPMAVRYDIFGSSLQANIKSRISRSIIVQYVDNHGKELKKTEFYKGFDDESYKVDSIRIKDYRLIDVKKFSESWGRTRIQFAYQKEFPVTLKFQDENGKVLSESVKYIALDGQKVTHTPKVISGYRTPERFEVLVNQPLTKVFTYKKIQQPIHQVLINKNKGKESQSQLALVGHPLVPPNSASQSYDTNTRVQYHSSKSYVPTPTFSHYGNPLGIEQYNSPGLPIPKTIPKRQEKSQEKPSKNEKEKDPFLVNTNMTKDEKKDFLTYIKSVGDEARKKYGNDHDKINHTIANAIDDSGIIIIRELQSTETYEDLDSIACMLVDMLNTEAMTSAWVAYSNLAEDITRLPDAYKEAHTALEVGKIFYAEKNVFGYNQLGIGRLIYQLPVSICEMFIDEIFKNETLDSIDEETLITIRTFFENNLNLSETSRQLYVHRNTLVYRFEKLQRKFGLDIRAFEDALTFKLAMMVVDYIKYSKNHPS